MVDLHEGLELHAQATTQFQHAAVVVRNAPWTRVQIQVLVELAVLPLATELGIAVTAAHAPVAAAGAIVELENLHLVASLLQLVGGRHARNAGAENQHGCAGRRALQVRRARVGRLSSVSQRAHRLIHRTGAGGDANHPQQVATARRNSVGLIVHGTPCGSGNQLLPGTTLTARGRGAQFNGWCRRPCRIPAGAFALAFAESPLYSIPRPTP